MCPREFQRVRPPRVRIVYDTETSRDPGVRELPFVVGVLADFSGQPLEPLPRLRDRKFIGVDAENLNDVLKHMRPRVAFDVDDTVTGASAGARIALDLRFESLDDFLPDRVAPQVGPVRQLLELRRALTDVRNSGSSSDHKYAMQRAELAHPQAMKWVRRRILERSQDGAHEATAGRPHDDLWTLDAQVAALDDLASAQLDQVMHQPSMQRLEATWRGLKYLLERTETSEMLRVELLNITKKELWRDIERAPEIERSALFKKVHEEVYGKFGPEPFGVLVGDFEFTGHSSVDQKVLEHIAAVAEAAHAPFLTGASADMFELASFRQIGNPRRPENIFAMPNFAMWRTFREAESSRYVALTVPRILLRPRYGDVDAPVDSFRYEEQVAVFTEPTGAGHKHAESAGQDSGHGVNHAISDNHLWGNAAWALAAQVTRAFAQYGWCATIWGVESGGLVEGLPFDDVRNRHGVEASQCPVEWPLDGFREAQLADLGFVPIVHWKGTPNAVFFSSQTAHKPKVYEQDGFTVAARLFSRLPFVFAASRFVHYLRAIVKDNSGRFTSVDQVERVLDEWIAAYSNDSDDPSAVLLAKYPLKEARVKVVERPEGSGQLKATLDLWPRFQLHGLTMSIRVHTRLGSWDSR